MNIDRLDEFERALNGLQHTEEARVQVDAHIIGNCMEPGHIKLYVTLNGVPSLIMYDNREQTTECIGEANEESYRKLMKSVLLAQRRYPGFEGYGIVKDFFINWDTAKKKEYIQCCNDILELTFMRFYANNKRKLKTICRILDKRIAKLKENTGEIQ